MFDIIFSPKKTMDEAKKNKNIGKEILTIIVASAIITLAILTRMIYFQAPMNQILVMAITLLIGFIIAGIVYSAIFFLGTTLLTTKGKFIDSLIAVSKTMMILAVGTLLSMILLFIPVIGTILATLIVLVMIIAMLTIFIRLMMTLTGADLLSIIIMLVITMIALAISSSFLSIMEMANMTMNVPVGV